MINKFTILILSTALTISSQTALAITINFDYSLDSNGFFNDTTRRDILGSAANRITSRLKDNLSAITSSGSNQFNPTIKLPDGTGQIQQNNASITADTLTIFVGSQTFSGNTVGLGGPGGFSAGGSRDFFSNITQRGQLGATTGTNATDFAPWGGSISFDETNTWFFDNDTSTIESFIGTDFYSVALHELGHIFGIGTSDAWANLIDNNGNFTGAASNNLFGGNISLDANGAHWQEGTLLNSQETAMDPSNVNGTRQDFTELDFAALNDIGWQIKPVPLPPAFFLLISGIIGLISIGKRKL
ncbi:hypothetical protein MNBD_GAMMA07-2112 [hydrothermal vent metagenome]|uniref:Peptidase M10 metallopeptidase domain-containing protein n=1 Tax=hydrothermal vent metagenome TaxID=652676 RepID=A0A3B0XEY2_9ZZZZ